MDVGRPGRISVEDIIFLIRKDPKKYSRVKELLIMNEELRKARKAFDEVKYVSKWNIMYSMNWLREILCEGSANTLVDSRTHNTATDKGGKFLMYALCVWLGQICEKVLKFRTVKVQCNWKRVKCSF